MGKVAVTFKLMPESVDTDTGSIKEKIRGIVSKHADMHLNVMDEKPVAFGLKSIEILIVMPDSSVSALEDELTKIEGVASVESGDATLI